MCDICIILIIHEIALRFYCHREPRPQLFGSYITRLSVCGLRDMCNDVAPHWLILCHVFELQDDTEEQWECLMLRLL